MEKLVIFADYGLDDAAATVSLLNRADRFSAIDIIPIGGNVPAKVSHRNCYTLLSCYPELLFKIRVVSTGHIDQKSEYLADIHGNDGMGDLFEHPENYPEVTELTFEEWLEGFTGDELVLSLGPTTLVRRLLEKHTCKKLVIMGGRVKEAPNFNGYEFNQALDTKAFAFCTKHPHVAITLDTCRCKELDMRLVEITGEDIHSRIIKADQALSITRGEDGCYVWDDVAACFLLFPERFEVTAETDPDGNRLSNAHYISDKLYFMD